MGRKVLIVSFLLLSYFVCFVYFVDSFRSLSTKCTKEEIKSETRDSNLADDEVYDGAKFLADVDDL